MALYEMYAQPPLMDRVLVMNLQGFIDAGAGGDQAMAMLRAATRTELIASFDSDALVDHRARRPVVQLTDGVLEGVTWPTIELRAGVDRNGRGVLLLTGPEPDMRWNEFCEDVVTLAGNLSASLVVGLGAFPAPVPHTRPVRLTATATSRELAETIGYMSGTLEVPGSIHSVLEVAFGQQDRPAIGIWARVPHYIANVPYPAASAAILDGLHRVSGIEVDTSELRAAAAVTQARITAALENSEDHARMLRALEQQYDSEFGSEPLLPADEPLPSGDEIAAELERFLRGEIQ